MNTIKSEEYIDPSENISIFEFNQFNKVENHAHEFIEIVYVKGGSGVHIIKDKPYSVQRGDMLIFNIGESHSVEPKHNVNVINILINPCFINRDLVNVHNSLDLLTLTSFQELEGAIINLPPKINIPTKEHLGIESVINSMLYEFDKKSICYQIILKGYLNVLIARIFRIIYLSDSSSITLRNKLDECYPTILQYIEKNYNKKITLRELATKCFFNPSYFGQVFKECYNMTPMEYVNHRRITEAVRILKEENYPIEQVCYMVGYKEKKQFYKLFKQYTGQTPGQFKKDYGT